MNPPNLLLVPLFMWNSSWTNFNVSIRSVVSNHIYSWIVWIRKTKSWSICHAFVVPFFSRSTFVMLNCWNLLPQIEPIFIGVQFAFYATCRNTVFTNVFRSLFCRHLELGVECVQIRFANQPYFLLPANRFKQFFIPYVTCVEWFCEVLMWLT